MNQTFNFSRFSKLFIKHTADNYKTYLMAFVVLVGVLFLIIGFAAYGNAGRIRENVQIPIFLFMLPIAGSIFSSIVFSDLGNKRKAISMLTLPASHFEKYSIGWIYSYLIFQILFIPAFYLIVMFVNYLGSLGSGLTQPEKLMSLFAEENKVYYMFFLYAFLNAICLLGSVFFLKHQFIKTAFFFFLGGAALVFINQELMSFLIKEDVVGTVPFLQINVKGKHGFIGVHTPQEHHIYLGIILSIIVVILWACSYYKIKEKEV